MKHFIVLLIPLFMIWTVNSNRNTSKCPDITVGRTCTDTTGNCIIDRDCPDHQICCSINGCVNKKICLGEFDKSRISHNAQKFDKLSGRINISRVKQNTLTSEQILSLLEKYMPVDMIRNMIVFFQRPFFFNSSFLEIFLGLKNSSEQALLFLDKVHSLENKNPKLRSTLEKDYLQHVFSRLSRIRSGRSTNKFPSSTNMSSGGTQVTETDADDEQINQTAYEALIEVVRRCCKGRVCIRVCNIDETASDTFHVITGAVAPRTENKTQKFQKTTSNIASRSVVRSVIDNQTIPISSLSDRIASVDSSNDLQKRQKNIDTSQMHKGTDIMLTQLITRVKLLEEQLLKRDNLINNFLKIIHTNRISQAQPLGQVNPVGSTIRDAQIARDDENTKIWTIIQSNQNNQRQALGTTPQQTRRVINLQQSQQVVSGRQNNHSVNNRQILHAPTMSQNQRLQQMLLRAAQTPSQLRHVTNARINVVSRNPVPTSQALPTHALDNIAQISRPSLLSSVSVHQTPMVNEEDDEQTRNVVLNIQGNPQMTRSSAVLNRDIANIRVALRSPVTATTNRQSSSLSASLLRNQQRLGEQLRQVQQQQLILQNNILQGQRLQNNLSTRSLLDLQAQQRLQSSLNNIRSFGSLQTQQQPEMSLNLLRILGGNSLQNLQLTNNRTPVEQLLQANQQQSVQNAPMDNTLLQNSILNSVLNQQQRLLLPTGLAQNIQNIARFSPRIRSQAELLAQQQDIIPQTISQVGQLASDISNQRLDTNLENTQLQQLAQILQNRQLLLNQPASPAISQLSLLQPPALTVVSDDQIQQLLPPLGLVQSSINPLFNLQAQNQLLDNSLPGIQLVG